LLLGEEAKQILQELQEALDAIETVQNDSRKQLHRQQSEQDEEDDPASDEHELSLLMGTLVAELRANLQEEVVHECTHPLAEQDLQSTATDPEEMPPNESLASNSNPYIEELPITSPIFDVPVSDFTDQASACLSPAQKVLLERLRHHLSEKPHHYYYDPEHDRVYQEIPDLEQSESDDVQFEKLTAASCEDPDYVPVQDFAPPRKKQPQESEEDGEEYFDCLTSERNQSPTKFPFAVRENARKLNPRYVGSKSRDEEIIAKLARSQTWRRICQIVFLTDVPDPTAPTHKTRLVEWKILQNVCWIVW